MALGRAVVADALRRADPAGATAAETERDWRSGYPRHFRRLIEAGLTSGDAALTIARDGTQSLYRRMRTVDARGAETELAALVSAPADSELATVTVAGTGEAGDQLALPYHGHWLRGADLHRRLDQWVAGGVIEPSCAAAVRTVMAHPEWLRVPDRTVAVLGAGAEIGPLPVLLGWGARVAGVDLPSPPIWERVLTSARQSAGTLLVPVRSGAGGRPRPRTSDGDLAQQAGIDLVSGVPAVSGWLGSLDGALVLGNYVYADGAVNVRVCAAVDVITERLRAARPDAALAFLATPTDVFAVPADAVAHSAQAYERRSVAEKLASRALGALSGGRLLQPGYPPGAAPGISDCLIPQQGPNYALAKRLQRWRAAVAQDAGATVSMNVAPPTRTRSVTRNRVLAAAYASAHRFGVEVFEPATCQVLMAALLIHDLYAGGGAGYGHPWRSEAHAAAHGGLWRIAYAPRSALTLAALLGYPTAGRR